MTIHFAAARNPAKSPIARALARPLLGPTANDNGEVAPGKELMRAALRHFSEHGLSAARVARAHAEDALFAGNRQSYDWWLGITRTLDRRLAEELTRAQFEENTEIVTDPAA